MNEESVNFLVYCWKRFQGTYNLNHMRVYMHYCLVAQPLDPLSPYGNQKEGKEGGAAQAAYIGN